MNQASRPQWGFLQPFPKLAPDLPVSSCSLGLAELSRPATSQQQLLQVLPATCGEAEAVTGSGPPSIPPQSTCWPLDVPSAHISVLSRDCLLDQKHPPHPLSVLHWSLFSSQGPLTHHHLSSLGATFTPRGAIPQWGLLACWPAALFHQSRHPSSVRSTWPRLLKSEG